jgi:enoyl-CoA hydratase/carnithine racemase
MQAAAARSTLQLTRLGTLTAVTLHRPAQLNAISLEMVRELRQALAACEADGSQRVLLLRGAGGKAFCAGGDIKAIAQDALAGGTLARDFFAEEYALNAALAETRLAQVSVWDGIVMGGGAGLSVHGRFRVATERTVFAMPETAIGFFPDVGASHFLGRLGGHVGTYLALTGARLGARDACRLGLATHYVPSASVEALDHLLARCASAADVDACLRELGGGREPPRAAHDLDDHGARIARCFGAANVGAINAALISDGSEWAATIGTALAKLSPTSLFATLHLLRQNAGLPLRECLAREFELACRLTVRPSDFFEGVRAALVDKDQKPRWAPATLDALDAPATLARLFEAPLEPAAAAAAASLRSGAPGEGSAHGPPRAGRL